MKKRIITLAGLMALSCALAVGCGNSTSQTETQSAAQTEAASETQVQTEETQAAESAAETTADTKTAEAAVLEDGTYTADFNTDSSMFQVNETCDGKGTLTVKDGKMTIHITLRSTNIVNLYPGLAEDAQKDGAELLEPTTDTVTYSDGMSEEVYGFDIPVPALDEEFDVALVGTKGKWYDHKVSVKNPVKDDSASTDADTEDKDADSKSEDAQTEDTKTEDAKAEDTDKDTKDEESKGKTLADLNLEDGDYTMEVTLTGGSGRATIDSPAAIKVEGDKATATIVWSSPNYDYMLVDGEKYEPVNKDGNSTFEIPVSVFDAEMDVTADTVAMSEPHEIDYTLNFDSTTVKEAKTADDKEAK